ncbi:MAG: 30S ribosomal protein S8 [Candidatus Micrarchaeia archaeon]
MNDILVNALNKIKMYEYIGRGDCEIPSSNLVKEIMVLLQKEGYIKSYEEFSKGNVKMLRVYLERKINKIGAIKPRFPVKKDDLQKYEQRYIPSKDFGRLIVSTPQGIMTSREAASLGLGGRLIAYVY